MGLDGLAEDAVERPGADPLAATACTATATRFSSALTFLPVLAVMNAIGM